MVVIRFQIMCTTSQLLGVKIKLKPVSFRGLRPLDPRQGALLPGPRLGLRPLDPRSLRSQAREKSSFPCPPLARGLVTPLINCFMMYSHGIKYEHWLHLLSIRGKAKLLDKLSMYPVEWKFTTLP